MYNFKWIIIFLTLNSVGVLSGTFSNLAMEIKQLKQMIDELKVDNVKLTDRLAANENVTRKLINDMETIKTNYSFRNIRDTVVPDQSAHRLNKRAAYHHRRHIRAFGGIAFQAVLSRDAVYSVDQSIKFNKILTNVYNRKSGYDSTTGVFTAPYSGIYMFHTNVVALKNNYVEASIYRNEKIQVTAVSDSRATMTDNKAAAWNQGGTMCILKIVAGDQISVKISWPIGEIKIHGFYKTTFGGYLLRKL